jgi:hypothetical protein
MAPAGSMLLARAGGAKSFCAVSSALNETHLSLKKAHAYHPFALDNKGSAGFF